MTSAGADSPPGCAGYVSDDSPPGGSRYMTLPEASVVPFIIPEQLDEKNGAYGADAGCDVLDYASDDSQPPPPYSYLPPEPRDFDTSALWADISRGLSVTEHAVPKLRLGCVDFVPRVIRRRVFRNDQYETFSCLIEHANSWLDEHQAMTLVSCETLTWPGMKTKHIFSDSTSFVTSMNTRKSTKYLRGLRLWYYIEVFPTAHIRQKDSPHIECRTYTPSKRENFAQLLKRVNKNLTFNTIGHILNVETFRVKLPNAHHMTTGAVHQAQRCYWREDPSMKKRYMLCIRVYGYQKLRGAPSGSIDFHDFMPENNRTHRLTAGYALYADVMQQVGRWVALKHGVRFTNVQALRLKMKRGGSTFPSRCIYTEHLTASNRLNIFKGINRRTQYLTVVRVYFVTAPPDDVSSSQSQPPISMTYRTFSPRTRHTMTTRDLLGDVIQRTTSMLQEVVGRQQQQQQHVIQSSFFLHCDGMRQIIARINEWLQSTGAKVFSIETLLLPYVVGSSMGSEATYTKHRASGQWSDRWLMYIRLYLDGEYEESVTASRLTEAGSPSDR